MNSITTPRKKILNNETSPLVPHGTTLAPHKRNLNHSSAAEKSLPKGTEHARSHGAFRGSASTRARSPRKSLAAVDR